MITLAFISYVGGFWSIVLVVVCIVLLFTATDKDNSKTSRFISGFVALLCVCIFVPSCASCRKQNAIKDAQEEAIKQKERQDFDDLEARNRTFLSEYKPLRRIERFIEKSSELKGSFDAFLAIADGEVSGRSIESRRVEFSYRIDSTNYITAYKGYDSIRITFDQLGDSAFVSFCLDNIDLHMKNMNDINETIKQMKFVTLHLPKSMNTQKISKEM